MGEQAMENSLVSRLVKSVYFKILVAAVFAFIGVAGGIYVGFAIVNKKTQGMSNHPVTEEAIKTAGLRLEFDVGDLFPLENYTDIDGQQSNFEQLLQGRESVLIFALFGCEQCRLMLEYWDREVAPDLRPGVQVVVCADKNETEIPESYRHLLDDKHLIFIDRQLFSDKYHFTAWPTVIAVDKYGFVTHIQFGVLLPISQALCKRVS
jgi:uncharacterized protein YneF (UPF0154 family)